MPYQNGYLAPLVPAAAVRLTRMRRRKISGASMNKITPHCMYRGFLNWRSRRDAVGLHTKDGVPS